MFGSRYAAANAGLLYTAKGAVALLVPLASVVAAGGGWQAVFWIAAELAIIAALIAILVLKPMRRRQAQRQENSA